LEAAAGFGLGGLSEASVGKSAEKNSVIFNGLVVRVMDCSLEAGRVGFEVKNGGLRLGF